MFYAFKSKRYLPKPVDFCHQKNKNKATICLLSYTHISQILLWKEFLPKSAHLTTKNYSKNWWNMSYMQSSA